MEIKEQPIVCGTCKKTIKTIKVYYHSNQFFCSTECSFTYKKDITQIQKQKSKDASSSAYDNKYKHDIWRGHTYTDKIED